MAATFDSFNRSALDAFQRSPLGERNASAAIQLVQPLQYYFRQDDPYLTPVQEFWDGTGNKFIGKQKLASSNVMNRRRAVLNYFIPASAATATSAQLTLTLASRSISLEAFQIALYSSDTLIPDFNAAALQPPYDGAAYNLSGSRGQLESVSASNPAVGTPISLPFNVGTVQSRAGGFLSLILGTLNETQGSGSAGTFSLARQSGLTWTATPVLTIV